MMLSQVFRPCPKAEFVCAQPMEELLTLGAQILSFESMRLPPHKLTFLTSPKSFYLISPAFISKNWESKCNIW